VKEIDQDFLESERETFLLELCMKLSDATKKYVIHPCSKGSLYRNNWLVSRLKHCLFT